MPGVSGLNSLPAPINKETYQYKPKKVIDQNKVATDTAKVKFQNSVDKTKSFEAFLKSKQPLASLKQSRPDSKSLTKNGIDLAAKEVAEDFEKQFMGVMWNKAFATTGEEFEGGMGEEFFRKELVSEVVKNMDLEAMSDIAEAVYEEIKNSEKEKDVKGY